ncbi:hypothetical protein BDY17DRAFT_290935 [Neohortaea acidophila]|uniref:Secreted protein n=1 Tax=Neohortaea acidophila TaxID=245834 RepID=A0A6A6Q2A5_9PEZI|nr:uncharacterized protein BDY17DRAFT_290935 [Neohortaea acidophila]KAF2486161.1 hypothetical protein BDY17DRAFT_290935 [Neohortaea acidophila]
MPSLPKRPSMRLPLLSLAAGGASILGSSCAVVSTGGAVAGAAASGATPSTAGAGLVAGFSFSLSAASTSLSWLAGADPDLSRSSSEPPTPSLELPSPLSWCRRAGMVLAWVLSYVSGSGLPSRSSDRSPVVLTMLLRRYSRSAIARPPRDWPPAVGMARGLSAFSGARRDLSAAALATEKARDDFSSLFRGPSRAFMSSSLGGQLICGAASRTGSLPFVDMMLCDLDVS